RQRGSDGDPPQRLARVGRPEEPVAARRAARGGERARRLGGGLRTRLPTSCGGGRRGRVGATPLFAGGGTGGHVFPMIAVADAVRSAAPGVEVIFAGTERGVETKVVPARGYRLELVRAEPLRGNGLRGAARGAWCAARAIPEARALVRRLSPR